MSHYQIMAVVRPGGPGLEEIMAPYSEHLKVPQYVYMTKEQLIERIKAQIAQAKADLEVYQRVGKDAYDGRYDLGWLLNSEWGRKFSAADPEMDDEEAYLTFRTYYTNGDEERFDQMGNLLSTYNPEARWDYWSEGSWITLTLKDGSETTEAVAEDVDWRATMSLKRGEKAELRRTWRQLALGHVPGGLKGDELELWLDENYGKPRFRTGYLKEKYGSFEAYVKAQRPFTPYAVVDADGWRAPGRVGWFGTSSESPEEHLKWINETLPAILAALGPDDEIHMLDCHI